jgi:hypothetical protein
MSALSATPTFPSIGSATFNADAYAWAVHMAGTFTTELNAAVVDVNSDVVTVAADKATVAADKATVIADMNTVAADKATVSADKSVVIADMATVAADKVIAIAQAAAAVAARDAAQGYATLAQATNPDAPVRLNPRIITTALNIASGYNAESVGPITIAEGITVTVSDNATWSVN